MSLFNHFVVTNDFAQSQITILSTLNDFTKKAHLPALSGKIYKKETDSAETVLFSSNAGRLNISKIDFTETPRLVSLQRMQNFSPVSLVKTNSCLLVSGSSDNKQNGGRKSATFLLFDKVRLFQAFKSLFEQLLSFFF